MEYNRRIRTGSIDKEKMDDLKLENVSTFWMKVENNEGIADITVYTVKIPTKDQNTPEVMVAKQKVTKFI